MNINVFVDMDGVLAAYDKDVVAKMYNEGFFLNRPVHKGNLNLVKSLISDKRLNVYILSSCLADSAYVVPEKNAWLDKYLPELPVKNRILVPEGIAKSDYIKSVLPDVDSAHNVLIDDYTVNLLKWESDGFIGVKMMNGLNSTNGLWIARHPNSVLNYRANPNHNYYKLTKLIMNRIN